VASVYAPIAYGPLPLLAFKAAPGRRPRLAAVGALRSVDPDRVVLKKIILTGYPARWAFLGLGLSSGTVLGGFFGTCRRRGFETGSCRSSATSGCLVEAWGRRPFEALRRPRF
jgi:hypothetical protein